MKNIAIFSTLFLISLIVIRCTKDPMFNGKCVSGCIIFQGQVFDPNNNVGVKSKIKIKHLVDNQLFISSDLIGELDTDEEGEFRFSFDGTEYKTSNGLFEFSAYKNGYLTDRKNYDGIFIIPRVDSTAFDVPFLVNIDLKPKATLNIDFNINNNYPISNFIFSYDYGNIPVSYYFNNSLPIDTTYIIDVGGDGYTYINYQYKKNSIDKVVHDSIFIKAGESVVYNVTIE
ncbi:MAG: hypothetical protein GC192_00860 [Bacteroidetes bacterium]|nr:hypothetical protein [Bacteroidota bacterium]